MRMIDVDKQSAVRGLQLYLTPEETVEFRKELDRLLANPEANEHSHISSEDRGRELSFSIITKKKLENIKGYAKLEQKILTEK